MEKSLLSAMKAVFTAGNEADWLDNFEGVRDALAKTAAEKFQADEAYSAVYSHYQLNKDEEYTIQDSIAEVLNHYSDAPEASVLQRRPVEWGKAGSAYPSDLNAYTLKLVKQEIESHPSSIESSLKAFSSDYPLTVADKIMGVGAYYMAYRDSHGSPAPSAILRHVQADDMDQGDWPAGATTVSAESEMQRIKTGTAPAPAVTPSAKVPEAAAKPAAAAVKVSSTPAIVLPSSPSSSTAGSGLGGVSVGGNGLGGVSVGAPAVPVLPPVVVPPAAVVLPPPVPVSTGSNGLGGVSVASNGLGGVAVGGSGLGGVSVGAPVATLPPPSGTPVVVVRPVNPSPAPAPKPEPIPEEPLEVEEVDEVPVRIPPQDAEIEDAEYSGDSLDGSDPLAAHDPHDDLPEEPTADPGPKSITLTIEATPVYDPARAPMHEVIRSIPTKDWEAFWAVLMSNTNFFGATKFPDSYKPAVQEFIDASEYKIAFERIAADILSTADSLENQKQTADSLRSVK